MNDRTNSRIGLATSASLLGIALLLTPGCSDPAPSAEETATPPAATAAATTNADALEPGVKPYPLEVCLVSGEPLGSMGAAIARVENGQQVKFCCESCIEEFESDKAKYLGKLAMAPTAATAGAAAGTTTEHSHADHDHDHDHAGHTH